MTKWNRTEFELTNPNSEVNVKNDTAKSVAQPGVGVNGSREELMAVAGPAPEQALWELPPNVATESNEVEGLPSWPFWDMLRLAGYQPW